MSRISRGFEIGGGGPPGPQGPQGIQGIQGVPGVDGYSVLHRGVDPDASNGVIGDFCINTSSVKIFGPRQSIYQSQGTAVNNLGIYADASAMIAGLGLVAGQYFYVTDASDTLNGVLSFVKGSALVANDAFRVTNPAVYFIKNIWGIGIPLVGPAGVPGPQGPIGGGFSDKFIPAFHFDTRSAGWTVYSIWGNWNYVGTMDSTHYATVAGASLTYSVYLEAGIYTLRVNYMAAGGGILRVSIPSLSLILKDINQTLGMFETTDTTPLIAIPASSLYTIEIKHQSGPAGVNIECFRLQRTA